MKRRETKGGAGPYDDKSMTFVRMRNCEIQLAGDYGGYLPSERAVCGGGYGALPVNGHVGPEGGRALVEATLREIDNLWK